MTKEELLLEETKKRMQRLYEYSFYHGVYEDGDPNADQQQAPDPMGGGDPNAMGGDPMGGDPNAMGGAPMPGADPTAGGDPNAMGGAPMGGDPNGGDPQIDGANLAPNAGMDGQGADPTAGGDPNAMGGDPMAGGDPNMMGGDPMAGGDMGAQPGPDDDVVDITQLTDAQDELKMNQEQTAEQLEDVDQKLSTLLQVVDKFTQALDANDQKIADLKRELVKRTPTEEETMNVRLNAGGNPFDQKPEEFWDKFQDINNHYNITANNDAPQYQIKKGDIDNVNDKMINDEFDEIPRSLHEYFVR